MASPSHQYKGNQKALSLTKAADAKERHERVPQGIKGPVAVVLPQSYRAYISTARYLEGKIITGQDAVGKDCSLQPGLLEISKKKKLI